MGSDEPGAATLAADPDDLPDLYGLAIARGSLVLRQWMVPSIDVVALSLACAAVVEEAAIPAAPSLESIAPTPDHPLPSTRARQRARLVVGVVMIVALAILCLAFAAR